MLFTCPFLKKEKVKNLCSALENSLLLVNLIVFQDDPSIEILTFKNFSLKFA